MNNTDDTTLWIERLANSQSLPLSLVCTICSNIFSQPVTTECGHTFCHACVQPWISSQGTCPICRRNIRAGKLNRTLALESMIDALPITCAHKAHGCNVVVPVEVIATHEANCEWAPTQCPNKGCPLNTTTTATTTAEQPPAFLLKRDLTPHLSVCDWRVVPCPNGCTEDGSKNAVSMPFNEVDAHTATECPNQEITCPLGCDSRGIRRGEVEAHLLRCARLPVSCGVEGCDYEGPQGMPLVWLQHWGLLHEQAAHAHDQSTANKHDWKTILADLEQNTSGLSVLGAALEQRVASLEHSTSHTSRLHSQVKDLETSTRRFVEFQHSQTATIEQQHHTIEKLKLNNETLKATVDSQSKTIRDLEISIKSAHHAIDVQRREFADSIKTITTSYDTRLSALEQLLGTDETNDVTPDREQQFTSHRKHEKTARKSRANSPPKPHHSSAVSEHNNDDCTTVAKNTPTYAEICALTPPPTATEAAPTTSAAKPPKNQKSTKSLPTAANGELFLKDNHILSWRGKTSTAQDKATKFDPIAVPASCAEITTVNLSDCALTTADLGVIVEYFKFTPNVTALDISQNDIGHEGAVHLREILNEMKNLKTLSLLDTNLGGQGANIISTSLAQLTYLEQLFLFNNQLGVEGAKSIAPALLPLKNLKILALERNKLGDEGVEILLESFAQLSPSLSALWLNANNMTSKSKSRVRSAVSGVGDVRC